MILTEESKTENIILENAKGNKNEDRKDEYKETAISYISGE